MVGSPRHSLMFCIAVTLCKLVVDTADAFSIRAVNFYSKAASCTHSTSQRGMLFENPSVLALTCRPMSTGQHGVLFGSFLDDIGSFMKRFTTTATASHILIKGGAEAENKLEDLKIDIGDSPLKFAEAAAIYSECPSSSSGGDLGEFGPGAMVKEFDDVVFGEEVGKVHGPVRTQFGYHLIYIGDRKE